LAAAARALDTPLVKQAQWIGTENESIAWARDDQHLAVIADGRIIAIAT
jgi:hypothetical protein